MAMAAATGRYLTDEQITSYRRDGYIAVPRVLEGKQVEALRRVKIGRAHA